MPKKSALSRILHSAALAALCLSLVSACASTERRATVDARDETRREITYGRLLASKILERYPLRDDAETTRYVNQVGRAVALFAGRTDIAYHFAVLESPSINAFATPGGYVFITRGALLSMTNEAELACVLAHEIAHINHKHIMKEFPPPRESPSFASILASILLARGTAVSTAFSEVLGQASELLFARGYKLEDEFEADATALAYAAATGYAPEALPEFLFRLIPPPPVEGQKKKSEGYGTHPPHELRIEKLRARLKTEAYPTKLPRAAERFAGLKTRLEQELVEATKEKMARIRFGRLVTEALLEKETVLTNPALVRYIGSVGKSLALFSGRNDFEYNFIVIDRADIVGYAAPGGYVVISKGALLAMESEAELAAALAIQIAHGNLDHLLVSIKLPAETAPLPTWRSEGARAARALVEKGYAAREVHAADRAALLYLTETGYEGKALLSWLGRLPARQRPTPGARAALVRELLEREYRGKSGQSGAERFRSERDRLQAPAPDEKKP